MDTTPKEGLTSSFSLDGAGNDNNNDVNSPFAASPTTNINNASPSTQNAAAAAGVTDVTLPSSVPLSDGQERRHHNDNICPSANGIAITDAAGLSDGASNAARAYANGGERTFSAEERISGLSTNESGRINLRQLEDHATNTAAASRNNYVPLPVLLSPPVPFNAASVPDDVISDEKIKRKAYAQAVTLSPAVPFNAATIPDDDTSDEKIKRKAYGQAVTLSPAVPFNAASILDGDNVKRKEQRNTPISFQSNVGVANENAIGQVTTPSPPVPFNASSVLDDDTEILSDSALVQPQDEIELDSEPCAILTRPMHHSDADMINQNTGGLTRRTSSMSTMLARVTGVETLIRATLVEEAVVVAERVSFFEQKWKVIAPLMCFILVSLAVTFSLVATKEDPQPTAVPTIQPSSPPTFDTRPTLEIVKERGYIECGIGNHAISMYGHPFEDFCRGIAAVLFGNPNTYSYELVRITTNNRFQMLYNRSIDLLMYDDAQTVETEVREKSTGAGFTFSSPYSYAGMTYLGNKTLVECAQKKKRYEECSSLFICVRESTTHHDFVKSSFPSDFFLALPSYEVMKEMMINGTQCNVLADQKDALLPMMANTAGFSESENKFIVGDDIVSVGYEPFAVGTRNTDREFSDIVNWVLQAAYFGEEQGLTKNSSLCQNYTNSTLDNVSDLNFMNFVYCVGNFGEIYDTYNWATRPDMSRINNGTGMLYPIPFGDLGDEDDDFHIDHTTAGNSLLYDIRKKGSLDCGVIVPVGHIKGISETDKLAGMGVDCCRTLAAALFNGNSNATNLLPISENDENSFAALNNRTIDVLAGGKIEKKLDFAGFQFSTSYYYGNETASNDVSFYSLVTREDDVMFSSFVNVVVLAMLDAQKKGITNEKSDEMPLMSIFGREFTWALKDAISYSGSYDQIYEKNFGNVAQKDRGRNILNDNGGPQLHSFPGLFP